jgi:methionyl aminopeptidase
MQDRDIEYKTDAQIAKMREAGLVVGQTLELLRSSVAPGMTTGDLDEVAEKYIRNSGATPSFKGYHGFPATICASVNNEIVHGIPGSRVLAEGDIVSIDCGAIVDGWHGDAAITVGVGEVGPELVELMRVCEEAMWHGLAAAKVGGRLTDIGHAVESYVKAVGRYGIVEEYVGHGIGSAMHQPPNVANYGKPGKGPKLVKGMALAIEPMITMGRRHTRLLADDWTVVTADGKCAAHFEHTVTMTEAGPWVLTALDGGAAKLAVVT